MKHKLLSLFALAGAMFMSASVWAQSWEPPVKPAEPVRVAPDVPWVAPEAGKTYYVYNVGAGQFMGAGRDWNTRVVTTADSVVLLTQSAVAVGSTKYNYALPFTLEDAGTSEEVNLFWFHTLNTNKAFQTYVFCGGNDAWADANGSGNGCKFQIVPQEDGSYLFHPAGDVAIYNGEHNGEADFQDEWRLLGVTDIANGSYTWSDSKKGTNSAGVTYKINWKFVEASDEVGQTLRAWTKSSQAQLDEDTKAYNIALPIYNARVKLYNSLNEAVIADVDYTDAATVYAKEDATEQELLTANSQLLVKVKIATSDLPVDITEVLQNPDFEIATANGVLPPGWDITIKGQNLGQQNRTDTNTETGASITNFIEAWIQQPNTLGNGHIAQTVYGLPAGKYRLECDATSCQQSGQVEVIEGIELFIQAGVLIETTSVNTGEMKVTHFSVTFDNDGRNEMQFGLRANDTNANWITADNFTLFYDGPLTENPNYKNLQKYLAEIQDKYNNEGIGNAYLCTDSLTALDNAMEAAANISKTATDEDLDAAYLLLEKAYNGAITSIKVYATLLPYTTYNEEGSKLAYYEDATAENGWNTLSQSIHDLQDAFDTAYEEGTWSDEEVIAKIDNIVPSIIAWVQANPKSVKKGNDLTLLLVNADFSEGSYGGTAAEEFDGDENSIPGWTISSGNITELRHRTGNIETYHKKFDFHQTIKNMPAGVYDITVQGFVRHDGSATDQTIFYAGDLETQLMLCSDQSSAEGVWLTTTEEKPALGEENHDVKNTVLGGYQCNGMTGFYYWSITEAESGGNYLKYQEGDLYYTNHIKATLNEQGDFTIGLKSLGTTDWIIWDNFKIMYLGNAGDIYALMAEEDFASLKRVIENTDYPTKKAKNDYQEISKIDYSTITTLEAYNEYKAKIDALIAYIKEGAQLGRELQNLLSEYQLRDAIFLAEFLEGSWSSYYSDLENGTSLDNDYLRNAPDVLAAEWTQCALAYADTTWFNNLDGVIINPKYTTADGSAFTLNGWSMEKADDVTFGNYLANEGVAEVYNPSGTYKHYQTIKGLNEGYYHITVDAYFRPGGMKQADGREACLSIPSRAFLFAEGGGETFLTPIKNILVGNDQKKDVGDETEWIWAGEQEGEETYEYTPNDVEAAANYFNFVYNYDAEETDLIGEATDQSVYRNALNAHVGKDGVLTIGITNYGVTDFVTNDWCCFSNWTLSLLAGVPDAIKGVSTQGATAPTAIFTIDGRQASRLQRGLNIVRQTDGSVKKVLVK